MAAIRAKSMNRKVLEWARKEAGLSQAQLASVLGQKTEVVASWEKGVKYPTILQLEKVASTLKRPLAIFFFSDVPEVESPQRKFRMLPSPDNEEHARDTLYAIRDACARQLSILELSGGGNPAGGAFLFRSGGMTASRAREALGVSISEQVAWRRAEDAFKKWRTAVEAVGVLVFKRSFKHMAVSGFCLPHSIAPVIVINNGTSWARQLFTLMHELGHLALGHHGVTRADNGYMEGLGSSERDTEQRCNLFAAQVLLPNRVSSSIVQGFGGRGEDVEVLAGHYSVSREVVLRRLLDLGEVDSETYQSWTDAWNSDFYARKQNKKRKGGNYYATQASYLGPTFLRMAFSAHLKGQVTVSELADHLGVKAKNVAGLEPFVEAA